MIVTYIIHRYAGTDKDRTVTVTGEKAELVLAYRNKQDEVGITIIDVQEDAQQEAEA